MLTFKGKKVIILLEGRIMKDIFIGLAIIVVVFVIIDFLYTEKNTCLIEEKHIKTEEKCGIIKKQLDININLFDRYW